MTDEIRVVLIGAGSIARLGHAPGLRDAGVRIVGICDVVEANARSLAAELGVGCVHTDHRAILEELRPNAVTLAIPNAFHHGVALDALRSGAHVLCEKPLASRLADAQEMVDVAESECRVLALNLHYRLRPEYQLLKAMIEAGRFGRVMRASVRMMRRAGIPGLGSWFTRKALSSGGVLVDLGAHWLDLSLWLLGFPKVRDVRAQTAAVFGPQGMGAGDWGMPVKGGTFDVEDFASLWVEFGDESLLTLDTSWACHGPDETRFQLWGERAGATVDAGQPGHASPLTLFEIQDGLPVTQEPILESTGSMRSTSSEREWRLNMTKFVDAVRGTPGVATGREGLASVEILERAYQNAFDFSSQCRMSLLN